MESSSPPSSFDSVEEAIAEIAAGRLIIVTDDENRENEGDLIMAASLATPETVNMMIRHGRGLLCVPTTDAQLRQLNLNPMVAQNRESMRTDFTVSVDAAHGISTGISAADRTATIRILANPDSKPADLVQPGHVFPLRARSGGVLERAGHTEAAVDLAKMAGLPACGVLCEILNDDGTMARVPELESFKAAHGLKMISVAQLIEYRHRRENLVQCIHRGPLETDYGTFALHLFRSELDGNHHFALTIGTLDARPTLVRVHSENLLADVFAVKHFGSRQALVSSLHRIAKEGHGVILYMTHPCGGLRLSGTPASGPEGLAPIGMDLRAYGVGAQILSSLGLRKIRLLSSTNRKVVGLDGYSLEIVEQIPL